jgi:hypothetical protein
MNNEQTTTVKTGAKNNQCIFEVLTATSLGSGFALF